MQTVNNNLTLLISKNAAIPHESSVMAIIRHVRFQDVWLRVTIHMSVFVKQNVIFFACSRRGYLFHLSSRPRCCDNGHKILFIHGLPSCLASFLSLFGDFGANSVPNLFGVVWSKCWWMMSNSRRTPFLAHLEKRESSLNWEFMSWAHFLTHVHYFTISS